MSTWISIPEAAKQAGLSRWQMRRRLRALNTQAAGRLLRQSSATGRVGKWEVCAEVLREIVTRDPKAAERELDAIHGRLDDVDGRLVALRNAHHGFRRRTEKSLADHARRLEALSKLSEAAEEVRKAFAGD